MPPLTPALLFASVIVACWIAPTSSFVIRLQGAILGSGGSGTIWFVGLLCAGVGDTLVLRWGLLHPAQNSSSDKKQVLPSLKRSAKTVRCTLSVYYQMGDTINTRRHELFEAVRSSLAGFYCAASVLIVPRLSLPSLVALDGDGERRRTGV